jgi:hypothetical protein
VHRIATPSATTRFHTTATHAVPSTTETPEHHFAAVVNTITPEEGRIRPKHVELYTTYNKFKHWCIKLHTHLPYNQLKITTRANCCIYKVFPLMMGYKYGRNI